jgi:hypothetical protein
VLSCRHAPPPARSCPLRGTRASRVPGSRQHQRAGPTTELGVVSQDLPRLLAPELTHAGVADARKRPPRQRLKGPRRAAGNGHMEAPGIVRRDDRIAATEKSAGRSRRRGLHGHAPGPTPVARASASRELNRQTPSCGITPECPFVADPATTARLLLLGSVSAKQQLRAGCLDLTTRLQVRVCSSGPPRARGSWFRRIRAARIVFL